jgi:hypothetical protein
MNSIERRYRGIEQNNPFWAPYTCLAEAVAGRRYNHKTIRRNFLKLVPKDDYEMVVEKDLIAELERVSNA